MASLKSVKILDNMMAIKEDEKSDAVRVTRMRRHSTEALANLSHANGSITQTRKDDTMFHLGRDFKQLKG